MKIIEVGNPNRVKNPPNSVVTVLDIPLNYKSFVIKKIELRQYVEKNDPVLGIYSLITAFIDTDKGSIEITYDEGFREKHPLDSAKLFLTESLGLSSLLLRALISLESQLP